MRRTASLLLPIVVLAFAQPAAARSMGLPELVFEGTPETLDDVRRLEAMDRSRLAGALALSGLTDPGPPIRVHVLPEGSPVARGTPAWISGFASSEEGQVVLFPARVGPYPFDSLEELLQHEVAHVLISRAAGGRPVPRWLHEGIAVVAGDRWGLEDGGRFALEAARTGGVPLADLDRLFSSAGGVARAYSVSGAFVQFLLQRHGPGVTGELLAQIGRGLDFEAAFAAASGETLTAAETAFWRKQTFWVRWLPLLTGSTVLWIAISALVLVAALRRRRRAAELREKWEAEEQDEEERRAAALARAHPGGATDGDYVH